MKKTFVISCLALIALFFTSSDAFAKKKPKTSDKGLIRYCIEKNLEAIQDEDVDAYLKTYKLGAEQEKKQEEAALKLMFEKYDFSVTLDSYKLISINGDAAVVETEMTIKKIRGPEFKDNRVKQRNALKKIDNKWYIVGTEIKGVVLINEEEASEEAAIRACIEKNIQATQDEDFDAFWETCKPANAQEKKQTETALHLLFKNYDLEYKIFSYNLTKYDGDTATVEVVMKTNKIRGSEFNNNQSKYEYSLKKIDGKWYIVNSKRLTFRYLD